MPHRIGSGKKIKGIVMPVAQGHKMTGEESRVRSTKKFHWREKDLSKNEHARMKKKEKKIAVKQQTKKNTCTQASEQHAEGGTVDSNPRTHQKGEIARKEGESIRYLFTSVARKGGDHAKK